MRVVAAGWPAVVVGDAVVVVAGGGGAGAPGVHAGAVAFGDLVVEPVGTSDWSTRMCSFRSRIGSIITWVSGWVHQPLTCSTRDRGAGGVAAAGVLVAQVHVDESG